MSGNRIWYERPRAGEDLLNRTKDVEMFEKIILRTKAPYTFSIEAPWGAGKSYFIGQLRERFEKIGVTCIGFNAWENDLTGSALGTIIGELISQLGKGGSKGEKGKMGRMADSIKANAGMVAKVGGRMALALGTGAVLPSDDMIEKSVASAAGDLSDSVVEQYQQGKKAAVKLQKQLGELAENIQDESDYPLIVFVDELDRCRPDYMIEVMETIKHLFSIPHIIFVLSIDPKAVEAAVSRVYSAEINSGEYIRKFIDMRLNLPRNPLRDMIYKRVYEAAYFVPSITDALEPMVRMAEYVNAAPRSIEQAASFLAMLCHVNDLDADTGIRVLVYLVSMKTFFPDEYADLRDRKATNLLEKVHHSPTLPLAYDEFTYALLLAAAKKDDKASLETLSAQQTSGQGANDVLRRHAALIGADRKTIVKMLTHQNSGKGSAFARMISSGIAKIESVTPYLH